MMPNEMIPAPPMANANRKTRKNAPEEAEKDDNQADLDPIKSKKHKFRPY